MTGQGHSIQGPALIMYRDPSLCPHPGPGHFLRQHLCLLHDLPDRVGQKIRGKAVVPQDPADGHGVDASSEPEVFISGQRRGMTRALKRALRRRSAIEPAIGHMKTENGGEKVGHGSGGMTICSSVNFDLFMVRSCHWAGLQYQMEELSGVRAMTFKVMEACRVLDIVVHDRLIIGRSGVTSFRSEGQMEGLDVAMGGLDA
ncbi:hypothetical protein [Jannaschia formosa]|uniref:hypothetical protein n=1 Tax=Jannaschia formosa TaxID=2259592 RepID=UPI001074CE85|nr:hypothetical protein [Jannaschia formosa]TFL16549.1 hypothetical protein DR046_19290 [Jannaschia formosa]